jgi:serine protease Do
MKSKPITNWKQKALVSAVTLALVGGAVVNIPNATATSEATESVSSPWQSGAPSFAILAEKVKPAVVSIAITGKTKTSAGRQGQHSQMPGFPQGTPYGEFFRHFFEGNSGKRSDDKQPGQEFRAVGSGFIISADGHVVTNNHVIELADEIEVIMDDGSRHQATVKGRDAKTDLALLKIETDNPLPYVELGNSDSARVGEWVVAVGNPFGLGGTVTAGIISARGRDIQSGPFDDFLQIDAPINRGNSGGPLFDSTGKVIGINTAIYSPSGGNVGIGFAIPANMARDVVAQLQKNGTVERGWLGVQIQPVTQEIADSLGLKEDEGALVTSVMPESPAEEAGILAGDVIVSMNGEKLDDYRELTKQVAKAEAGSNSTFEVHRQGKTHELDVEIGRMQPGKVELATADSAQDEDAAKLGIYLAELSTEARQRYKIDKTTNGVLVANVKQDSPAARAGIRTGSVINMVGQQIVTTPDEVIKKVQQAAREKQSAVLLRVQQNGQTQFVTVKFARA